MTRNVLIYKERTISLPLYFPASVRRHRDLEKCIFPNPYFLCTFTSGENPQEFSRNKSARKMNL